MKKVPLLLAGFLIILITAAFSHHLIYMYHFIDEHEPANFHVESETFQNFINQQPNSNQLPKRTYTIKAIADYSLESLRNSKDLSAEVTIRVD